MKLTINFLGIIVANIRLQYEIKEGTNSTSFISASLIQLEAGMQDAVRVYSITDTTPDGINRLQYL